jgi:hypothetical protein
MYVKVRTLIKLSSVAGTSKASGCAVKLRTQYLKNTSYTSTDVALY